MPLRALSFLCLLLLSVPEAGAQHDAVGTCARGEAFALLETAHLQVPIRNDGGLFWDPYSDTDGPDQYRVPKADGASPVFAASLWLSGLVDGDPRTSAATYGPWEMWPGALPDPDDPPRDCSAADRIWVVSRADVAHYVATGEATPDLAEWPHELGAPVLDGDGDPTTYDLAAGDRPDLLGDVAAFWVMNDAGNAHAGTGTAPLGVEVRGHAFAFEGGSEALRHAAFLRYEVVNRRDVPLDSLRLSLFTDVDLGDPSDDFVGSDTLRSLLYVYNSDDADETDRGYGAAPPAWGAQVLRGLVGLPDGIDNDHDGSVDEDGERIGLATSVFLTNNGPFGDPDLGEEFANVQRGRGRYGAPLRTYGQGYGCRGFCLPADATEGEVTRILLPGDPVTGAFWSEVNADDAGGANDPSPDRRSVLTTGPGRLAPGARAVVDIAFPYARGADHLASVTALRAAADEIAALYATGLVSAPVAVEDPRPTAGLRVRVRPNPSAGAVGGVVTMAAAGHVEAAVLDVLGRRVATVHVGALPAGQTALALPGDLPAGVYLLRVTPSDGAAITVPFTVVGR